MSACNSGNSGSEDSALVSADTLPGTFGYDLAFLQKYDSVIVLTSTDGQSSVIVSPAYQAKVFTSTTEGPSGKSFGWVNYTAFDEKPNEHMNAFGGENRLWLGPEGGPFSLYFKKGDSMVFENWRTPPPIDIEPWDITDQNSKAVTMRKEMALVNYAGTSFSLTATRKIELLDQASVETVLGMQVPDSVKQVAYLTVNSIRNTGSEAWTETTGMPCIWMLDMFRPSPQTSIIIPFKESPKSSRIATTDYFGEIDSSRIAYTDSVLLFSADGKSRGKLGLAPDRATNRAGSYDAENKVLTITVYDVHPNQQYLNQEWGLSKPPFSGDAVNAYNDGPLADGSQMGPFYEIESVGPAAFLAPGQEQEHKHRVFHFTGPEKALDQLCEKLLGISLEKINKTLSSTKR